MLCNRIITFNMHLVIKPFYNLALDTWQFYLLMQLDLIVCSIHLPPKFEIRIIAFITLCNPRDSWLQPKMSMVASRHFQINKTAFAFQPGYGYLRMEIEDVPFWDIRYLRRAVIVWEMEEIVDVIRFALCACRYGVIGCLQLSKCQNKRANLLNTNSS